MQFRPKVPDVLSLAARAFDFAWDNRFWIWSLSLALFALGFSNAYKSKVLEDRAKVVQQMERDLEIYRFQMFKYRKDASLADIKLTNCLSKGKPVRPLLPRGPQLKRSVPE